ncbi:MAG: SdrD B-like domain-containing protein [Psychroflexus sp.]|uniref:SdrD B-like domain-containing protein n=1 Tax=Psychroflexus sp. S27 TaxID=1982757 RepID=UPI000C2AF011|nr:SdrD B-like domain-containing protein [Psychroflexus sp. S27]PJX28385.1 hypothetical protein CAP47_00690 [Psychroflexus sp. S27]
MKKNPMPKLKTFHLFFLFFFTVIYQVYSQDQGINFYQNILNEITAQKGTLTGKIYRDVNGNGTEDVGEPGIENVSVIFVDSNGNGQTVQSDANGNWTEEVIAGNTLILIDNTSLPSGALLTEGTEPSTINVISGGIVNAEKLGYAFVGDISGHVYYDVNGNGIQNGLEADMANVEIIIEDDYGNSQSIFTDANGDWSIQ